MADQEQDRRDQHWIQQIQEGNRHAFKHLFQAYVDQLYTFAVGHVDEPTVAEDIVQDVFCDLWSRRVDCEPKGTVKAYLYRAVRNTALDHLDRCEVREVWREEETQGESSHPVSRSGFDIDPVDTLCCEELQEAIQKAVERLPGQQKLVYQLAHHHDLSYMEIASTLGIARKTVENHMGRALKSLRSQLAKHDSSLK